MKIAFFSSALLFATTAMSATPINGWYSSIFSGTNYLFDNLSVHKYGLAFTDASYEFGYEVGGRLGLQANQIRYEGELTYLNADLRRFYVNDIRQTHASGNTDAIFAMANAYYDFPDMVEAISPFLGVGIGYGWIKGSLSSRNFYYPTYSYSTTYPAYTYYRNSSNVFAYQATFGFTYNFEENYALNIAYRYIGTNRVDALGKVFQANLATVGVIYRFNEHIYK
ncbi:opacity protein-like surface antigen [Legionella beliardensis]|uniref:Opacity protein-like surface antigen n=1 Tax=Legionella beliardensis TaxID=91822 RepID=A0A378I1Z9_9GAMM|nr:outer membrane beta-barrel protein [Legionella beliardensis]STX28666.1 opacity protein-like surface antigen [Legionella beliardensis]